MSDLAAGTAAATGTENDEPIVDVALDPQATDPAAAADVIVDPPAGDAGVDTAAAAATELSAQELMATFDREQLLAVIQNNGVIPDELLPKPAEAKADDPPAVDPAATAGEGEPAGDPDPASVDPAAAIAEFKFTENAAPEVLAAEEAQFLELVELPAPLQEMLERRDTRLAELEAAGQLDDTTKVHMQAFDQLVTYKPTEEEGVFVPDTDGIRSTLKDLYPAERRQVVIDLNSEPSDKYPGLTVFQEFMRDGWKVDDQALQDLEGFLERGGRFDVPSFVPEGLETTVAEAYFTHPNRAEFDQKLSAAEYALENGDEGEKATAKNEIAGINRELQLIQSGIDSRKEARERLVQADIAEKRAVVEEADRGFSETTKGLMDSAIATLAKAFETTDGDGAGTTASGVVSLVYGALSPYPDVAANNQELLKAQGITYDWVAARAVIDKLWTAEQKVAGAVRAKAHPRAIEIAREAKKDVLLELKGIEKQLTGKISEKRVKGAGTALKNKIAGAAKLPIGGKPKAPAAPANVPTNPDYSNKSPEELRSILGQMRREAAEKGQQLPA